MASPYYTFSYKPGTGSGDIAHRDALSRWLSRQRTATQKFASAEKPLREAVNMFQVGGGYGEGQRALLQDQAKQALAEAMTNQVASGMSSGSLATSTALRTKSDLAKNLAGVEDTRTQFLTQALQALSGLRGTEAQTIANLVDPTYAPYMSYVSGANAAAAQQAAATLSANAALKSNYMQTQAQKEVARIQSDTQKSLANTGSSTNLYNFKY